MQSFSGSEEIWGALRLVGERVAAAGLEFRVVIIGGAALNFKGVIARATSDVDIIALATESAGGVALSPPPEPLPEALLAASRAVAKDLGLDPDWLDRRPAELWRHGLPAGLATRLSWERTGGLWIGIVDRIDLIPLKLYAAADESWVGQGRHYRDLLALRPAAEELRSAREWVEQQDASAEFARLLERVVQELRNETR